MCKFLLKIPPWSFETNKVTVEGTEAQRKERSFMDYKGVCTRYGSEPKTLDHLANIIAYAGPNMDGSPAGGTMWITQSLRSLIWDILPT